MAQQQERPSPGVEQRRFERIAMDRPVQIETASGLSVRARLVDLSLGGAGIAFSAPAEVGAVMRLTFSIPTSNGLSTLRLRAQVRHSHLRTDGHVIGFQFLDVDDAYLAVIRHFIAVTRTMRIRD